ncbi:hypothetical protein BC937DRAFT_88475 [Endogone sp. FLAS-F59071]|nr:hypothetical protein BC937DRAFT_88475 [Endogone sp. FLAS-F59071]|eukprot:RUS18673.1 hypothetical protein BC937DRAFT_88475 [Endogone sp. FLAS-F59071]
MYLRVPLKRPFPVWRTNPAVMHSCYLREFETFGTRVGLPELTYLLWQIAMWRFLQRMTLTLLFYHLLFVIRGSELMRDVRTNTKEVKNNGNYFDAI